MPTTAITKIEEVKNYLMHPKVTEQFKAILPKHIDVARFQRVAVAAVHQNPALLECDKQSLFIACVQAAQAGLYTDAFLGESYLIPYKGRVQFQPGYKGLLKLIRQSGDIASISANVVYAKDNFKYVLGDAEYITHEPTLETERGKLKYAYAIARFKDGSVQRIVLTEADINKAKASSQSAASPHSPWNKFTDAMWIKTAIKRLTKLLPLSTDIQRIIAKDDAIEIGRELREVEGETIATEPAIEQEPKEEKPKNTREAIIKKAKAKHTKAEIADDIELPPIDEYKEEMF